jgi:hypothetical protein
MLTVWFEIARRSDILMLAIKVALVVGSICMLINHGDVIFGDGLSTRELIKITLTYFVPYCVSTYSSVETVCVEENKVSINKLIGLSLIENGLKLLHRVTKR